MNRPVPSAEALKKRGVFRRTVAATPATLVCAAALVTLVALLCAAMARAEVCKGAKVSLKTLKKYDGHLPLSAADANAALAEHLPFGTPQCARLLVLTWYVDCYDAEKRIPQWVAYKLTADEVVSRTRKDAFRTDPRLTDDENAHCADYQGTGYDRGHSAPNADFNRSAEAQADTYYFSNMSPQTKQLNEQRWAELEDHVRAWAKKFGTVYVVMGPIFVGDQIHTLPSGRVAIPTEFFKIVLRKDENGNLVAQAFVMPNGTGAHLALPSGSGTKAQKVDKYLLQHATSIAFVERLTGIEYFPGLPAAERTALETSAPTALWPAN